MRRTTGGSGALAVRWLITGEWRAHPARIVMAAIAIAVGVALGFAVHLINGSALDAFAGAVRSVNGSADVQVRAASPLGFDELIYPAVARSAAVADASPVVSLRAQVGARRTATTIIGLDVIRAAAVTPSLVGKPLDDVAASPGVLFSDDSLFLSRAALKAAGVSVGDSVAVSANGRSANLRVVGILPGVGDERAIGVVDIAAAQWRFGRLGVLDRIDLKLVRGASSGSTADLAALLPSTAYLSNAESESDRGSAMSRAYRVNLDMLALVALLTGAFLVFSAQSLSVARRMRSFALTRTLGAPRAMIVAQVAIEGAIVGTIGGVVGLGLGYALAAAALRFFGGDLGAGYFGGVAPRLSFDAAAGAIFFAMGVGAALAGSILPARTASRAAPALTLKGEGDAVDPRSRPLWKPAAALLAAGVLAAFLPAVGEIPVFGYGAMGLLLAGAVAAMPVIARSVLKPFKRADTGLLSLDLAIRHLIGSPGQAAIALAGVVASTGLMIAMATMVTSFRGAVDDWLGDLLSDDLYLRVESQDVGFQPAVQRRIETTPGVEAVVFSRELPLTLQASRPAVALLARPIDPVDPSKSLPLLGAPVKPRPGTAPVYVSEPAARSLNLAVGEPITLPIGPGLRFTVAGIWRDYARQHGAVAIDSRLYERLTGDSLRQEAAVRLKQGADPDAVAKAIAARVPEVIRSRLMMAEPAALRSFALRLFDRSFAITYLLEAVAIIVGLAGIAATISAQTIARTREFGMLRHIGATRQQILLMLAGEGALLGTIGLLVGILLGLAMSQVLIHVVNPQSFGWTMTTRIPLGLFGVVGMTLVLASAGTAMLAGRHALSVDAVRAVREDW